MVTVDDRVPLAAPDQPPVQRRGQHEGGHQRAGRRRPEQAAMETVSAAGATFSAV
ncbi:hypothetical protein AB0G05_23915 [Nonomuraea wenchangensis]